MTERKLEESKQVVPSKQTEADSVDEPSIELQEIVRDVQDQMLVQMVETREVSITSETSLAPQKLQQLQKLDPTLLKTYVEQAVAQREHERELEKIEQRGRMKLINNEVVNSKLGMVLGTTIILTALMFAYLIGTEHPNSGVAIAMVSASVMAAAAALFGIVNRVRSKSKEVAPVSDQRDPPSE